MANQVSYRGIPKEVQTAIKTIAGELDVTTEEVARAFLEFGLYCFRNNEIDVQAHIKGRHMTLFPNGWNRQPAWTDCGWGKKAETQPREKKKREPSTWQTVVTYRRIPLEVKKAIQGISALHTVPVGEVATLFFLHAPASLPKWPPGTQSSTQDCRPVYRPPYQPICTGITMNFRRFHQKQSHFPPRKRNASAGEVTGRIRLSYAPICCR